MRLYETEGNTNESGPRLFYRNDIISVVIDGTISIELPRCHNMTCVGKHIYLKGEMSKTSLEYGYRHQLPCGSHNQAMVKHELNLMIMQAPFTNLAFSTCDADSFTTGSFR